MVRSAHSVENPFMASGVKGKDIRPCIGAAQDALDLTGHLSREKIYSAAKVVKTKRICEENAVDEGEPLLDTS